MVPQGARPRHRGRRSARLLAAGDVAPHHGDHRRPGRQPDRGVRDPCGLLRRRHPQVRADDRGQPGAGELARRADGPQARRCRDRRSGQAGEGLAGAAQGDRDLADRDPAGAPRRRREDTRARDAAHGRRPAPARLRLRHPPRRHPALQRVALGEARRRGGLAGHEGHRRGAQEPRLDRRSQQRHGRRRHRAAAVDGRRRRPLPRAAGVAVALARALQPAAVPAARRRSHPVRADRARAPQAAAREVYERVSMGGIAVFLVLFLLVLQSDVSRIIDGARPGP